MRRIWFGLAFAAIIAEPAPAQDRRPSSVACPWQLSKATSPASTACVSSALAPLRSKRPVKPGSELLLGRPRSPGLPGHTIFFQEPVVVHRENRGGGKRATGVRGRLDETPRRSRERGRF
jgi:hypothetical protein